MTDDRDPRSLSPEALAQLRARAAAASERLRELVEQARELRAKMASLRAEREILLAELRSCRMALHKVDRFP